MFVLAMRRPMTDKLLNIEYEQNPPNLSGASEAHIWIYIYIQND
jgi:hypothetical protein